MKILMGVDGSEFSRVVLQATVKQFRIEDTEVQVLHVLQPTAPVVPEMAAGYAPELAVQKKPASELVERIAKELVSAGFKVKTAVEIGDIRETIIDSAAAWNADLIVVGSHGQRGIRRFMLGSVAGFVARHAKCSVEIVRTPVGG